MSKFFITVRSVSGNAFNSGETDTGLGAIRYLIVPDDAVPDPTHEVKLKPWVKAIMATFSADAQGCVAGDLLFVVHGFNQGVADVDDMHGHVVSGLAAHFPCTVVSFDWPSWTNTFAYLSQLDIAKLTAIDLVNAGIKPLLAAQTDECRVAVHALCHSMGAYVVREALDHADDGTKTGSDWTLNQLVLVAGDVEASDFVAGNKDTESMLGHSYRLTNYFSGFDEVLQISNFKRLGVEPRVGRVGLPANAPDKTVNIDCSNYFDTIRKAKGDGGVDPSWSHSWYFTDPVFYRDLASTLNGKFDRTVVSGRELEPDGTTLSLLA